MKALEPPAGAALAVIFLARMGRVDAEYARLSPALRQRAMREYGCLGMHSACENELEITISYWADEADIDRWRDDPQHRQARQMARERGWYRDFSSQRVRL